MKRRPFNLILALLPFLVLGCTDIPNDGVPSYLYIPNVSISTTNAQGSSSEKITDIWLEVEGEQLGAYELPVTIPILTNGPTRMIIAAGIKDNGISTTRVIYPFYVPIDTTLNFIETQTLTIKPRFVMSEFVQFTVKEDFELGNIFDDMQRTIDPDEVFEGNASGKIKLDENNPEVEAAMIDVVQLPRGQEIYVELDYRSDVTFRLRVEVTQGVQFIEFTKLFIGAKEDWNKIYINMTDDVVATAGDTYRFIIAAELPAGTPSAEVFIDNFKVMHF